MTEDRSAARRLAAEAFYGPMQGQADASRRVGWESAAAHALRLHALVAAIGPVAELASVLDVGCGEGALVPVLRAAGFAGRYRGEDVRQTRAADMVVCDSFAGGPSAAAVVCSGTLNTLSGVDHDDEVAAALTAMWARTEEVLALDLAVGDRHAAGVGLGRADLARAWAHARRLAPAVVVREDAIPGEAMLVLSRSRRRTFARLPIAPEVRAEALLFAAEPTAALAELEGIPGPRAAAVRGQAWAATGRPKDGLAELARAAADFEALGDREGADQARLAQAPILWRLADRAAAEALLVELAARSDDARAHLFELRLARRDRQGAEAILAAVVDPWIRRELAERLNAVR